MPLGARCVAAHFVAMNLKPQTTFVNNLNPWTGVAAVAKTSPLEPEKLEFCTDGLPVGRIADGGKYDELFSRWKLGTAVKCRPEHVGVLAKALSAHVKAKKLSAIVRTSRKYPGDKTDTNGRVWLLPKE